MEAQSNRQKKSSDVACSSVFETKLRFVLLKLFF